jgi:hypothetical protein
VVRWDEGCARVINSSLAGFESRRLITAMRVRADRRSALTGRRETARC